MYLRTEPAAPAAHEGPSAYCPRFQYAIELVGRRWVGAILRVLVAGPARFNELLAAVPGLSDRLLTERLRELEREGVVSRTVAQERPVKVTYALTECGKSLADIIGAVGEWAERWVEARDVDPPAAPGW